MNIVYVVAHIGDAAGGPRVIVEHINGLIARGHTVEIWAEDVRIQPYYACNAPLIKLDTGKLHAPDVVVITEPSMTSNILPRRKNKNTYLLLQHDNEWLVEQNLGAHEVYRTGFAPAELGNYGQGEGKCEILVVSSWLRNQVQEKYGITSHLVLNGVDHTLFHPTLKPSDTRPQILMLYDPQAWKGFDTAYLAAHYAHQFVPNLKIAAFGRFMPPFPAQGGQYGSFTLPVTFYNRPEQRDLADLYSCSSVFVSASSKEGFGLPGLEAMACGVPVVTTDSGGSRDYAIHEQTALVVQSGTIPDLGAAILRILNEPSLRARLIKNGRRKAAEFTWDSAVDMLEHIFAH
jgi:glycosyltransferase involved in cell wall biosynthesis